MAKLFENPTSQVCTYCTLINYIHIYIHMFENQGEGERATEKGIFLLGSCWFGYFMYLLCRIEKKEKEKKEVEIMRRNE